MTSQSYERELGRLQADMENANNNMSRIEKKLDAHMVTSTANHSALEEKIDEGFKKFEALLNKGQGAWSVIIIVASVVGSIATLLGTKLLTVLSIIK